MSSGTYLLEMIKKISTIVSMWRNLFFFLVLTQWTLVNKANDIRRHETEKNIGMSKHDKICICFWITWLGISLVWNFCPLHTFVKIQKVKCNILGLGYFIEFNFSVCLIFQIPVMAMSHMIIETASQRWSALEQTKTIKLMIFWSESSL